MYIHTCSIVTAPAPAPSNDRPDSSQVSQTNPMRSPHDDACFGPASAWPATIAMLPSFLIALVCFVLPQSVSPLSAPQSSPQGLEITNDVAGYTKVTFYSSQNPLSKHTKLRPKGTPSSVQKKKKASHQEPGSSAR